MGRAREVLIQAYQGLVYQAQVHPNSGPIPHLYPHLVINPSPLEPPVHRVDRVGVDPVHVAVFRVLWIVNKKRVSLS